MRKQELERQQAMAAAAKINNDFLGRQKRLEAKAGGEHVEPPAPPPRVGIKHRRNKWRWKFVPY